MTLDKSTKYYIQTLLTLITAGVLLSFGLKAAFKDNHVLLMMLVVTSLATVGCGILNLIYFLPESYAKNKYIVPGLISIIGVTGLYYSHWYELLLFGIFALINLVMGIVWSFKAKAA